MKKVIFIIGLPGSGKSEWCEELSWESNNLKPFDEYQSQNIEQSRDFDKSIRYDEVIETINLNKIPVIIDVQFCKEIHRVDATITLQKHFPDISIEWLCFKNEPEQCKKNVLIRRKNTGLEDKGEFRTIDEWSIDYTIPEGSEVKDVYRQRDKNKISGNI